MQATALREVVRLGQTAQPIEAAVAAAVQAVQAAVMVEAGKL
jgi:hypothetical protein